MSLPKLVTPRETNTLAYSEKIKNVYCVGLVADGFLSGMFLTTFYQRACATKRSTSVNGFIHL